MGEKFGVESPKEKISRDQEMMELFGCSLEQIARSPKDIQNNTKAYVGKLEPGIFELIQKYNIEHVYTSFPESELTRYELELGTLDDRQLFDALKQAGVEPEEKLRGGGALTFNFIMQSNRDGRHGFQFIKQKERLKLITLRVKDLFEELGKGQEVTLDEIYNKAEEYGLELCQAEVGPYLRLQLVDQPEGENLHIGMYPINVHGANDIFGVSNRTVYERGRDVYKPHLDSVWADRDKWSGFSKFIFRLLAEKKEKAAEEA